MHVINKGSGFANGDVPEDMIRQQIKVLDESYSGRTGGAGSGFDFQLAGVTRTTNAAWFSQMALNFEIELEAKRALKRGGPETLNIYTVDGGPYLGFAYYPNIVTDPTYSDLDGIVAKRRPHVSTGVSCSSRWSQNGAVDGTFAQLCAPNAATGLSATIRVPVRSPVDSTW